MIRKIDDIEKQTSLAYPLSINQNTVDLIYGPYAGPGEGIAKFFTYKNSDGETVRMPSSGYYSSDFEYAKALALVITEMSGRFVGRTACIIDDNGKAHEYWFENGIQDENFVEKKSDSFITEGFHIISFDGNGADSATHQNSVITDSDGYVVLPVCTFVKTGNNFVGWSESGIIADYSSGDVAGPYSESKKLYAVWNVPKYTLSWEAPDVGSFTVTSNGVIIQNGVSVESGSNIIFNWYPDDGQSEYQTYGEWHTPASVTPTRTDNQLVFTMPGSNVSGIRNDAGWIEYTLTVSESPDGTGSVTINPQPVQGKYRKGTTVNMEATPVAGYLFDYWDLDGTHDNSNPLSITMQSNISVTACFKADDRVELSWHDPSLGTIDAYEIIDGESVQMNIQGGAYDYEYDDDTKMNSVYIEVGKNVSMLWSPEYIDHQIFKKWECSDVEISSENPFQFDVPSGGLTDISSDVSWDSHYLSCNVIGTKPIEPVVISFTPENSTRYEHGTEVTVKAQPREGYKIVSLVWIMPLDCVYTYDDDGNPVITIEDEYAITCDVTTREDSSD